MDLPAFDFQCRAQRRAQLAVVFKALSDPTSKPLDSAVGLKAWGAWEGAPHEGN